MPVCLARGRRTADGTGVVHAARPTLVAHHARGRVAGRVGHQESHSMVGPWQSGAVPDGPSGVRRPVFWRLT